MARTKKAAIYCRISRDMTGKRQGVERQEEDCRMLCRMNGYDVYKVYVDNSVSAHGTATKSGKERPEYDLMIKDFAAGKIDVIVAWKLDRLTRSVAGLEEMLKELAAEGLCICTTDLGGSEQDLTRADTVMLAQIMASFAQFEASRKGERTKRANKQRAEKGIMRRGTRCFGYDRQNKIIDNEAEVVRAIYEAYAKGSSMGAITRAVAGDDDGTLPGFPQSDAPSLIFAQEQQAKNPEYVISERVLSRKWSLSTTQAILRNPKYAGYTYYAEVGSDGKARSYNSSWRDYLVRDAEGEIVKGATWEPIVSEELWWKCQQRRDANLIRQDGTHIEKKGNRKKHIGAGVYRCGICGRPMKSGSTGNRPGYKATYTYRCDGHVNRMGEKIDFVVRNAVRDYLSQPFWKDLFAETVVDQPKLKKIQDEISGLQASILQTEYDYDEDIIDGRTYRRKTEKLNAKIAKLEDERSMLLSPGTLKDLIESNSPVDDFDALTDPAQVSRIIDGLCTVTLFPHKRGKRVTDKSIMDEVNISWKF